MFRGRWAAILHELNSNTPNPKGCPYPSLRSLDRTSAGEAREAPSDFFCPSASAARTRKRTPRQAGVARLPRAKALRRLR